MSFLSRLFSSKKEPELVVLIDIGTDSVAGAYVECVEGTPPVMQYTRRLPIEIRGKEPHQDAMLRALAVLGDALIREGAPVLVRVRGSASINRILVSVDAPWQTTSVRTEALEQDEPFILTRDMVAEVLKKTRIPTEGHVLVDEGVIGAFLNGYETRQPYGKRTHRVSIIVLTSHIAEHISESIQKTLKKLYHTKNICSIAGSSLRYQALRVAFPHERDALIVDATGPLTSLTLVRHDLLVDVSDVAGHTSETADWTKKVLADLADLAQRFPLPRTIFLLARELDITILRDALTRADLSSLWLSDNPPKIVALLGSHIVGLVKQATTATPDLPLLLMALYWSHRSSMASLSVDK